MTIFDCILYAVISITLNFYLNVIKQYDIIFFLWDYNNILGNNYIVKKIDWWNLSMWYIYYF